MIRTESDILDHARKAGRIARNPAALSSLRANIVEGIDHFLVEFESQYGDKPEQAETVAKVRLAAEMIRNKPLEWFAEWHNWMDAGATKGAASMLKMVGKIGR